MRPWLQRFLYCCFSFLLVAPLNALAQATPEVVQFNAQTFRPVIGPGNLITLDGTLMPRKFWPYGGVFFQFANRPLRLVDPSSGATFADTVPAMFTAHVMPGFGIAPWMAVSLDLPIVLYQGFDERTPAADTGNLLPTSGGVGDLRLMTKFRIVNNEDGGFGLAAVPQFGFPTGSAASFRSENTVTIEPRLAADYRVKNLGLFVALNVGFMLRTYNRTVDFGLTRVSDQLRYGIGIGAPIAKGLSVLGELNGAVSFAKFDGGDMYAPLEGFAAARYTHSSGFEATVGGGGAFIAAVGTPNFRIFASIGYVPTRKKPVGGGEPIGPGTTDPGPSAVDTDSDGVQGDADECPNEAGPAANKGCPDKDRDKDGVVDRLDKCPKEAGAKDNEGCPDTDTDKDGVVDRLDKCPDKAGAAANDGCPEENLDGDKDGVADKLDRCPAQAGPAENGGCPDTDEDKDGVVDRMDKCPKQAGAADNAGCPLFEIGDTSIKLSQPIKFAPGKDTPEAESNKVIIALAKAISDDPSIKKAQITVTASGDKKAAKKLAGKRAKNLTAMLVDHGASKKQLAIKAGKAPGEDQVTEVKLKKGKVKAKKEKKAKKPKKPKK